MNEHSDFVWKNYITASKCPAKTLSIMAHSAGGRVTADLFKNHKKEFLQRVKSLVFTDAYYHDMFNYATMSDKVILAEIGINFKIYKQVEVPFGQPLKVQNGPILEVSAGTNVHLRSTGRSLEAIWSFMREKLD